MKKLLSVLFITTALFGSLFAKDNTFADRIFETKTDIPLDFSNNTIAVLDYFQDPLIIDLNEFARKMPSDGLKFTLITNPQEEFNLNLKKAGVKAGLVMGVDVFGQFGISKGIFNFICNGNEIGEEIDVSGTVRADVFGYAQANASFKVGKFGVTVSPAYFIPVAHAYANKAGATVSNTDNGDFILDLDGTAKIYSCYDLGNEDSEFNPLSAAGFDMGGSVTYPINNHLKVTGSIRFPMAPGHLRYSNNANFSMYKKVNLKDFITGSTSSESTDSTDSESETVDGEESSGDEASTEKENKDFDFSYGGWGEDNYLINRPFKLNGMVDFDVVPSLITLRGGLGFGVRNPFSPIPKEALFYPEYYLGAKFDLLHIFSVTLSTEYTNTIFKHQLATVFNVRVMETDFGVSTQSASFAGSLRLAGVGAFINFAFGF